MIEHLGDKPIGEIEEFLERGFLISGNQRITKEPVPALSSYRFWHDWEARDYRSGAYELSTIVEMEHLRMEDWSWIESPSYQPRRQVHGKYDQEKQLPNNRMQPTGSGTDVWLNTKVLELLGEEAGQSLINQSVSHGTSRYKWLCAQLAAFGHPEVAEQYHQKKKDAAAIGRLEIKQAYLQRHRVRLLQTPVSDEATRKDLQKQIIKAEKYISERTGNDQ